MAELLDHDHPWQRLVVTNCNRDCRVSPASPAAAPAGCTNTAGRTLLWTSAVSCKRQRPPATPLDQV